MEIAELLRKYGLIRSIPSEELAAAGFELRTAPDGARYLHRRGSEDPAGDLSRKLAHALGVPQSLFAGRSMSFLRRLVVVLDEELGMIFDGADGTPEPGRLLDGRVLDDYSKEEWLEDEEPFDWSSDFTFELDCRCCMMVEMLRAKAAGKYDEHIRYAKHRSRLAEVGIEIPVWFDGIGERLVESSDGQVTTEAEVMARLAADFNQGLETFGRLDGSRSRSCLKELASRFSCAPDSREIMRCAVRDRSTMQVALSTALRRLDGVKRDNRMELDVANYHIKRALSLIKSGPGGDAGHKLFRARWSRKDPLDDLLIGNDAGCCLGVYGAEDEFCEAPGRIVMPQMLADPHTQFLELWCGDERVGLALCFACRKEREPILTVNSVELSPRVVGYVRLLVELALGYILDLAAAAKFSRVVMGKHKHNTGVSHCPPGWLGRPVKGITRLSDCVVYGDVFRRTEEDPDNSVDICDVCELVLPARSI